MNELEELNKDILVNRIEKSVHYLTIFALLFVAFVSGFNIGKQSKPDKVIEFPPITITPDPIIQYPVPTREI